MDIRFNGKRALVTGAGRGIGRAVAKALAQAGAEVFALSRTQETLDSLKQEVPGINSVCVDLADLAATRKTLQNLGPIHLLVNNAGIAMVAPFLEVDLDDYDDVMNVNVKAVLAVSQIVARGMVERGEGGSIVNLSSQASQRALPEHTVYCTSKGALDALTRSMALELGPHQIRVNCVNPTVVMTDMGRKFWSEPKRKDPMLARIPMRKFAEVEDVVNATLFLLSDQAAMINGTFLPVEGGFFVG